MPACARTEEDSYRSRVCYYRNIDAEHHTQAAGGAAPMLFFAAKALQQGLRILIHHNAFEIPI